MELKITINMDNDAFVGRPKTEIKRIINGLLNSTKLSEISFGNSKTLMDINGNSVGKAEIS
jgi:hypothetical protein